VVKYFPVWNEFRADCSCGWVGSYLPSRGAALNELDDHIRDETGRQKQ